jgi:hypothetical protein
MYVETVGESGIYPQVGGSATSQRVQNIYWRCVYVFFWTAKFFNSNTTDISFLLCTNSWQLPVVDGVNLETALKELDVEIIRLPYTWWPAGNRRAWFNQYYLFDILGYLAKIAKDGDAFIVLDNDCVFVRDLTQAFATLRKEEVLLITVDINEGEDANGLTRRQATQVYEELDGQKPDSTPEYFGGECYGLTAKSLRALMEIATECKTANNNRAVRGLPYLSDEAHMFSYLMWKLGYRKPTGNLVARRIWTSWKLNKTRSADLELTIWHLPSEKPYGFLKVYAALTRSTLDFNEIEVRRWLARHMGIGKKSIRKFCGHLGRAVGRRVMRFMRKL